MALTDNLIAHWKLDEASGTRADSHGSNTLSDNNTVTQAVGKIDNAALFVEANTESLQSSDNADLSLSTDTAFTIALWIYLNSKPTSIMGLVTKGAHTSAGEYALQWSNSSDRFTIAVGNGSSGANVSSMSSDAPTIGAWHFLIAWHDPDADTINICMDNGVVDSTAWSGGTQDTANLFFLGRRQFGQPYDGRMDSVSFWKRVLTSDERTALYNSGNGLDYDDFDGGGSSFNPLLASGFFFP